MRLLEFVEKYNNMANNTLKEQLLSKIKITPYVSIIKKDAYAQLIVDKTTFEQEAYDDNGVTKYRKTDKIRVNSVAQYVQFCRAVIELYTDLEIDEDDKGFIKGYDALKSSGLLDILMVGSDKADPLIPMSELSEFKTILTMKQSDIQFNETTTQAFISKQIGRISDLANATLTPFMDVVSKKLDEIPKEDLDKVVEFAKNGGFKEVQDMEIINLPRGCGKTTNIIIEAVKTGYPIITLRNTMKRDIERRAEKITNKKITVYTVAEFLNDNFWCDKIDKKPEHILIDELPYILEELLGSKCETATMTSKSLEEYYGHRDLDRQEIQILCYKIEKAVTGCHGLFHFPFNPALLLFLIEETFKLDAVMDVNLEIKLLNVVALGKYDQ